jgi:O-antigen/teichoic acid export membrane protein
MKADLAILIRMVPAEEVGYYSVALAIAMGQNGLASSLIQVNFPKVSTISSEKAALLIWRQLRKSVVPIVCMGITVALCSPLIIRYLFGPAFIAAQKIAIILVVAITIWGIGQIVENGLRGLGLGFPGAIANLVGFLALLISASYFVRTYKSFGMALSLMLSQIIVTILLIIFLHRITTKCRRQLSF